MKTYLPALTIIALLAITNTASAQNYRTGVGLRMGYPFGLTVKHFITEPSAVEVIVGGRHYGGEVDALYEYNVYPAKRKEFDLYFGGGGHMGVFTHHRKDPFNDHPEDFHPEDPYLGVGIDGIVGCSWTFSNAPVNLGFDYKPGFEFYRHAGYIFGDFAFSVRYAFGSSSDRNHRRDEVR